MSKLIALCDGHGMLTAGKRTPYLSELGRFVHENEFNKAVVNYLNVELKRCGFRTLLVAPTDSDTSLKSRVDLANAKKADAYVSIHFNALDGKFDGDGKDPEGLSVHIDPGSTRGRKLAQCILNELVKGTTQKNRGIVEQHLYVTKWTKMVAVLSENGFMDNKKEALLMLKPSFQKEVAVEHAKGICKYFNEAYVPEKVVVKPKPVAKPNGKTFYRVVTGSFSDRENAEARMNALKKAGFESFIDVYEK